MRNCRMVLATLLAVTWAGRLQAQERKPLFDYPLRDTSVCLGPDGLYYLTGTTGYPTWWQTNQGVRMWRSRDLTKWEPLGLVWSLENDATWQQPRKDAKEQTLRAVWLRRSITSRRPSGSRTA